MTVTWKSKTGVDDLTSRSTVAGPTIVVGSAKEAVWNATASAAGTGVQSQSGVADQALPVEGRLVAGRTAGSRVKVALPDLFGAAVLRDPPVPKAYVVMVPAGGHCAKPAS